ncbi:hypothetical protein INT43_004787, partial [Umbelopsis isabellina]
MEQFTRSYHINQEWMPPRKKYRQNYSNGNCGAPLEDSSIVGSSAIEQLLQGETAAEQMAKLTVGEQLLAKTRSCKYMHYSLDFGYNELKPDIYRKYANPFLKPPHSLLPPQWIKCDIRKLDFDVIGKFAVILADPPWDIHMSVSALPYGTMTDDEMKQLKISKLQDQGFLFLWVTSRAMELGRECMLIWGYELIQEMVWVKTNQLQRIIRTGRTGHWLNHSKEHCLIGKKGQLPSINKGLDCDVIVSDVRETSRKPDELYRIINRLSPGTQMFGRENNLQPGWMTLGNQLKDSRIYEIDVVTRYNE